MPPALVRLRLRVSTDSYRSESSISPTVDQRQAARSRATWEAASTSPPQYFARTLIRAMGVQNGARTPACVDFRFGGKYGREDTEPNR